jgi:hypothetical protein
VYATIEECTAYADTSLEYADIWGAADEQKRTRALETASRHIDATPLIVIPAIVPDAMKNACCEEALFLLSMSDWDKTRLRENALGLVGQSMGDANEYSQQTVVQNIATKGIGVLSPIAKRMLRPYIQGAGVIV